MAATDASVISDPRISESIRNPLNSEAVHNLHQTYYYCYPLVKGKLSVAILWRIWRLPDNLKKINNTKYQIKVINHGYLTNLSCATVRASTTEWESRIDAMCIFCNLGQFLPKPSTMVVRSVLSFSWQENSREISFKFGQLKAYKKVWTGTKELT
jgi:hypothetical protein